MKRGFYEKVAARRDQRASVFGKILGAMENSCELCDAILREYRIAYLDFWERASEETRDACKAVGELIGGSEADLQRVEDRLPRFRPMTAQQLNIAAMKAGVRYSYIRREDPLRHAMLKRWLHQQATGHVVHIRTSSELSTASVASPAHGLSEYPVFLHGLLPIRR